MWRVALACVGVSPPRILLYLVTRQVRSGRRMEHSGDGFSRLREYSTKDLDKNG